MFNFGLDWHSFRWWHNLVICKLSTQICKIESANAMVRPIHTACSPHQYALATRLGTAAVVNASTTTISTDPTSTIVSIDGVGAYDTLFRASMLEVLHPLEPTRASPSSAPGTPSHPPMCGTTPTANYTLSHRLRAASKAIPSCQHCSPLASMERWQQSNLNSSAARPCMLTSTSSTRRSSQTGSDRSWMGLQTCVVQFGELFLQIPKWGRVR